MYGTNWSHFICNFFRTEKNSPDKIHQMKFSHHCQYQLQIWSGQLCFLTETISYKRRPLCKLITECHQIRELPTYLHPILPLILPKKTFQIIIICAHVKPAMLKFN